MQLLSSILFVLTIANTSFAENPVIGVSGLDLFPCEMGCRIDCVAPGGYDLLVVLVGVTLTHHQVHEFCKDRTHLVSPRWTCPHPGYCHQRPVVAHCFPEPTCYDLGGINTCITPGDNGTERTGGDCQSDTPGM